MGAEAFARSEALLGADAMARLASAHALVVGVGGVGSWCAEALARTGFGQMTLVDDDVVAASNLNRQCPATVETIGRPKVEAMRDRLRAINPDCVVTALCERYPVPHLAARLSRPPTLVVDAIDSVDCKAELILSATEAGLPIVSSMGAALRTDPTQVRVTRFEKVSGDGLAKALRQRFRRLGRFPAAKFDCVWSAEAPLAAARAAPAARGSLMPVTATFGMCLASAAIDICRRLSMSEGRRNQENKGGV